MNISHLLLPYTADTEDAEETSMLSQRTDAAVIFFLILWAYFPS